MVLGATARRIRGRLRAATLRGDAYECPCCGHGWRSMASFKGRPNAACPGCGALERNRLLWLYLDRETSLFAGPGRMLHFAPEERLQEHLKAVPGLEYESADLDSPLAMTEMDITAIPRDDGSYDAILCSHVLEHVPDDAGAMRELFRVLRPGGTAYLQHPIDHALRHKYENPLVITPDDRAHHFGQRDHVRWFGADFADLLTAVGFEVTERRYVDELPEDARTRYALVEHAPGEQRYSDVYECVRPA